MARSFVLMLMIFASFLRPAAAQAQNGIQHAIAASVVLFSADLEEQLLGSGFRYLRADLVVTNAHVVAGHQEVVAQDVDGERFVAAVIGVDSLRDIAVLRVPVDDSYLMPRPDAVLTLGQTVYAIGAPFGAEFTLTRGVISAADRQIEANVPVRMIQHDAAVNPGSSGGPLVDANGHLVGMNSQIEDGFRSFVGMAYAIPAATLAHQIVQLEQGLHQPFPSLGLKVRPVSAKIAAALGLTSRAGVLVESVAADAAAAGAGLLPGDILLSVAGMPLRKIGDLAFALEAVTGQTTYDLIVLRAMHRISVTITQGEVAPLTTVASKGTPQQRQAYLLSETGLQIGADGYVEAVTELSLAHYQGLRARDRILSINGVKFADLPAHDPQITQPALLLLALSDGSTKHVILDPWARSGRLRPVTGANVLDESVVVF